MNILPQAKNAELVVQDLGKELLIYDLKMNVAFTLNETLTTVFNACDGKTSFAELQRRSKFTEDLLYLSLDILRDKNLLAGGYQSKFAGVSRREVIRKVGLACAVALPVIAGIAAPTAAQAQSASVTCATSGSCFCKFTANTSGGVACSINDPVYSGTCSTTGASACTACVTITACSANNLCQGVCAAL